jgi:uncharacterized protein
MNHPVSRRDALKSLAAAGVGALLAPRRSPGAEDAAPPEPPAKVPTRPFGRTGVDVSCLALGGIFDIVNNQLVLKQSLEWGVTYWDTADCYTGGRSETGIGKYFGSHPEARKQVFLVSKSDARDADGISGLLAQSLERMKTDYIDLYFLHGISDIEEMSPGVRAWAERAKKDGKIRFFGFSTHSNMEECLKGAARLGWVDGIMFTYNYRLMHKKAMKEAVEACAGEGIGLTAMKTQGGGQVKTDSEKELEFGGRFLNRGFTDRQAKLKAVWEDARIASICSAMYDIKVLMSNVAASMNRTQLAGADLDFMRRHAEATQCGYCAGCAGVCGAAVAHRAPVGDVMRCLLYARGHGDVGLARETFAGLPAATRARLADLDYSVAEAACPHRMPIARLMKEAAELLG